MCEERERNLIMKVESENRVRKWKENIIRKWIKKWGNKQMIRTWGHKIERESGVGM